jgi:hypothetical protein
MTLLEKHRSSHWARWATFVGVIAGLLGGTRAQALSCSETEIGYLIDPMVVVVSGPGSAAEERTRLEAFKFAYVEGDQRLHLDRTTFEFEVNP